MNDGSETVRVLHVDDNQEFVEVASIVLEREREALTVETATSVDEGLDRLSESEFDCLVSDYDLVKQTGIDFLEAVREEYPDLPFILFTGKGSEEVAADAFSAGATDYPRPPEPAQHPPTLSRGRGGGRRGRTPRSGQAGSRSD